MLNPAFNINHMREMIPIFYEVTHKVMYTTKFQGTHVFTVTCSFDDPWKQA